MIRKDQNDLQIGAPQAMQVAVSKNADRLVAAQGKGNFGLVAGLQHLALAALVSQYIGPLDKMFFGHGMFHRAHGGGQGVALNLNHGQVFFNGGIHRTGNQLGHFFTAAEHGYAAGLEMEDNVAAMAASVDFQFHIKVF